VAGRIRVLYFAQARDEVGRGTETIGLSASTVDGLMDELVLVHPGLKKVRGTLRLALNQELVNGDAPVNDGDELALLPPVAGG